MCEEIDLSDNYLEGSGAVALARMLKDNMFIVTLVNIFDLIGHCEYTSMCIVYSLWIVFLKLHGISASQLEVLVT